MNTSIHTPEIRRNFGDLEPVLSDLPEYLDLLDFIEELTRAARAEGRALAGSTAPDVEPLAIACDRTDAAQLAARAAIADALRAARSGVAR